MHIAAERGTRRNPGATSQRAPPYKARHPAKGAGLSIYGGPRLVSSSGCSTRRRQALRRPLALSR